MENKNLSRAGVFLDLVENAKIRLQVVPWNLILEKIMQASTTTDEKYETLGNSQKLKISPNKHTP